MAEYLPYPEDRPRLRNMWILVIRESQSDGLVYEAIYLHPDETDAQIEAMMSGVLQWEYLPDPETCICF
jgi:hypothetical protein